MNIDDDGSIVEVLEGSFVILDLAKFCELTKAIAVHTSERGTFALSEDGEWSPVDVKPKGKAKTPSVRAIKGTDSTGPQ